MDITIRNNEKPEVIEITTAKDKEAAEKRNADRYEAYFNCVNGKEEKK